MPKNPTKYFVFDTLKNIFWNNWLISLKCHLTNNFFCLFTDGSQVGFVSVDGNDRFIMKMLDSANLSTIEHELPLKLARKSVNVFGTSVIEEGKTKNQVDFGYDEETVRYGLK